MKILHITTHWTGGGSERNIAHTVECLRDAGHEVHLAIGRVVQEDTVPLPSGIAIHRVASLARAPRPLADARAFLAVRSLVNREKFDVVHTHLAKAGFVGRLGSYGSSSALAHTVHNQATLHTPLYRRLDRLAARRTTAFVFVGEELRDMYATRIGVTASKLHVIRSAVGASSFLQVCDQR